MTKTKDAQNQLQDFRKQFLRIKKILFVLLVVVAYIFIMWRINILSIAQPSRKSVASHQTTEALPQIDPATVNKIKQLQNDSVSVQALFNQARQNPFQE
jgi:cell division protein FtsB